MEFKSVTSLRHYPLTLKIQAFCLIYLILCVISIKFEPYDTMKMKVLNTRTLAIVGITSLAFFFSCGKDDPKPNPYKDQLGKLSKTWNIVSADLDGNDRTTPDFTGFTLTISGSFDSDTPEGPYDFDVAGSRPTPSPWPGATEGNGGTWEFVAEPDGDSGLLLRDDGIGMSYEIVGGELKLEFNFTGPGYQGARTAEVEGDWTFILD